MNTKYTTLTVKQSKQRAFDLNVKIRELTSKEIHIIMMSARQQRRIIK